MAYFSGVTNVTLGSHKLEACDTQSTFLLARCSSRLSVEAQISFADKC